MSVAKRVAVIGAGWAGCTAAVELAEQGHQLSLFEAGKIAGGRARRVEQHGLALDNGQHIMLGAYRDTLKVMRKVGVKAEQAFARLPLQMCYPEGSSGMRFIAPKLPAPLHVAFALWRATGLSREDKMALARFSTSARWIDWRLNEDCSVNHLLQLWDQPERLCRLMWIPLCIAALNTPPERASAQVFLNVLRDSLGAKRAASDMLLPRQDLSTAFPEAALIYLQNKQAEIAFSTSLKHIQRQDNGNWQLQLQHAGQIQQRQFDVVVLATGPDHAAQFMHELGQDFPEFTYEAISTCYLQYAPDLSLPRAFYALLDDPEQKAWGQFVFDRGQLHSNQSGLLAVVVSAAGNAIAERREQLADAIAKQLAACFKLPQLAQPLWYFVVSEKRATFSCTPGIVRPENRTGLKNLVLAGDYTAGDYPATLEAAVRSGMAAAKELKRQFKHPPPESSPSLPQSGQPE